MLLQLHITLPCCLDTEDLSANIASYQIHMDYLCSFVYRKMPRQSYEAFSRNQFVGHNVTSHAIMRSLVRQGTLWSTKRVHCDIACPVGSTLCISVCFILVTSLPFFRCLLYVMYGDADRLMQSGHLQWQKLLILLLRIMCDFVINK